MADSDKDTDQPLDSEKEETPQETNENLKTAIKKTTARRKTNLLQWMEISVSEPEKRTGVSMKMQETFTVYLIETRVTDPNMKGYTEDTTSAWRRYSEFELLRNYLEIMYPAIVVSPLPEKKATYVWQKSGKDNFDPDFIERRRAGLEIFLLRLAAHSMLSQDQIFQVFLKKEDGWKDMVYATDFQNKAESKLKSISASFRLKKPDRRFEELKNYSNELQSNLTNMLKIRARLADRLYAIHKVHSNYSRVFIEWSGVDKDIADPLQGAAHYMEVFANSVDSILDEEEQYADQLKEYLGFGDSVRSVCRKQECLQYDLERVEDSLSYKASQKDMLQQGRTAGFSLSSMKSKIFGSDTPEQREQKIKQLEEQIAMNEEELRTITIETEKFVELSLRDIDRFERQKVKDLREIFTNFAVMQIKECKKGIAIWTSAKDCFGKM